MSDPINETSQTAEVPLNTGGIHTQASNFLSAMQSAVDPRTGQFNLVFNIELGIANNLGGPSLPFTLAFSSLGSHRNQGFGLGWSLLCSELSLAQGAQALRLGTGEQYAVQAVVDGEVTFRDYKLQSLRAVRTDDGSYRITHKDGRIEILKRVNNSGAYVLHELRSDAGRRLHLKWSSVNGVNHLREITDDNQWVLARIDRSGTSPKLLLAPGTADEAVYVFGQANNRLASLHLPEIAAPFTFSYEAIDVGNGQSLLFPKNVSGPLGATDTLFWSKTAASSHRLPNGAPIGFLPRVLRWEHTDSEAAGTLSYSYTWNGVYNYLGYGSQLGFQWESGRDNLYRLRERYEYSVTETLTNSSGSIQQTVQRHWDRHHLQTLERRRSGDHETRVDTSYHVDYDKSWEEQAAFCQCPRQVTTTFIEWQGDTVKRERSEIATSTFDRYGNPLESVQANGVIEFNEYYPIEGERGSAPEDALGMVRRVKLRRVTPPISARGAAPVMVTRYTYAALPSLIPGDPALQLVEREQLEDETAGTVIESTCNTYIDTVGQHYARLASATKTVAGQPITTRHSYSIEPVNGVATLLTTTVIEGDETDQTQHMRTSTARSLTSGQTLRETSAAGVHTDHAYDRLGRVVRSIIASGTEYEVTRTASYHLSDTFVMQHAPRMPGSNGCVSLKASVGLEERDATGQRKRSWLDGAGRTVRVELEDLDHVAAPFRCMSSIEHDALGREVSRSDTDWATDGQPLFSPSSTTTYDHWGNVAQVTAGNGVTTHTLHDPIAQTEQRWQSAQGKAGSLEVVHKNLSGSPVKTELFDDGDGDPGKRRLVRTTYQLRDGLDRVIEQSVVPAVGMGSSTHTTYDAFSRVVERLEVGDSQARKTLWTYAPHSNSEHPASVALQTVENP
ncbi:hypothetical protein [Pseudomonas sichuanensis]|uniref:hypothetical protein n=1 Tax=Pseudomonas sichuanensis TaxID=2213015 RepID=UPI00215FB25D|nr:hypothetical protein [Pseudomonas sichuanensis]UVL91753.1 hypothetical protein LOY51_13030 [Pseudomonas sichuanensis]